MKNLNVMDCCFCLVETKSDCLITRSVWNLLILPFCFPWFSPSLPPWEKKKMKVNDKEVSHTFPKHFQELGLGQG